MVVFGKECFLSGKSGSIWAKVVKFGQKWLYWGKSCGARAKVVVFVQSCCIGENMVVIG